MVDFASTVTYNKYLIMRDGLRDQATCWRDPKFRGALEQLNDPDELIDALDNLARTRAKLVLVNISVSPLESLMEQAIRRLAKYMALMMRVERLELLGRLELMAFRLPPTLRALIDAIADDTRANE